MIKKVIICLFFVLLFLLTSCNSNHFNELPNDNDQQEEEREEEKITITLKNDEKVIESIFILPNQTIELPILEKEGYSFIGWYLDINNEDSRLSFKVSFSEDTTIYCKWEQYTKGLIFELIEEEYFVIGYEGTSKEISIPKYYQGYLVTHIGKQAFLRNENITVVHLPDSIISIEEEAFKDCYNLKTINFPNSIISIKTSGFQNCQNLSISEIDAINIYESAFEQCKGLVKITLSNRVKTIGKWAFYANNNINEVIIYESVDLIEDHAFSWCQNVKFLTPVHNIDKLKQLLEKCDLIYFQYTIEEIN